MEVVPRLLENLWTPALPYSQNPAIGPYSEPAKSRPHPIHIILQSTSIVFRMVSSLKVSRLKFCMDVLGLPEVTCLVIIVLLDFITLAISGEEHKL